MNTRGLVNLIAEETGQTKEQTEVTVKTALNMICGVVASGEAVRLPDFGIFAAPHRLDEKNQQAGDPVNYLREIEFSPAEAFCKQVNDS
jgi:nucleoid DNA-binding protein